MNILSRLRLRTKLALLLGLFAFGLVAATAIDASSLHRRMLDDRADKLKATVDMILGPAASLEHQVAAQQMTRDQAMARLRDIVHAMRFDAGDGYLTLQSLEGVVLIHGTDPSREDKRGTAKDADGRPIIELIRDALRNGDSGVISYLFPKPGQTQPQPKVSYVARFAPLNAVFLAGAYIDDLESSFHAQLMGSLSVSGAILLVTLTVTWLVNRDIGGPLGRLNTAMAALANGDLDANIPDTGRHDEVGEMAAAVQVFKDNAIKVDHLKAEQEVAGRRAADEKKHAMTRLATEFESSVGTIVEAVATAAVRMETTASSMTATADQTSRQVGTVAAASEQASSNVQSVATAAEELSISVAEISRQVASSAVIAAKAVSESERTNTMVSGLADAAQKIGAVTNMINEIASQTNLLALNATIEAARAGDAGKGFAVVAAEVKNLANQTAKATEEISRHIADMQSATGDTVDAIQSIGTTIGQINEIATTIASAVEEQGAATREIARNVQQVAVGTEQVTRTIADVSRGAGETGMAATQMLDAAEKLSRQAERLTGEVGKFIAGVKAA